MSGEESEQSSDSYYNQSVWDAQTPYLTSMYGDMNTLWDQTNPQLLAKIPEMSEWTKQIAETTDPYWKNMMEGGVYQDMDLQNQLMRSINTSLNNPSATSEINAMIMGGEGNNYADAMRDQYMQDASGAHQNMLRNMDARAAGSGMSGGSRHGTAIQGGMKDINANLQRQMAQTGYETFDKDLQRKLAIAGQADQNTLAQQQMMQSMLGQQQQAAAGGLSYANDMQNIAMGTLAPYYAPWQMAGQYSAAMGGPTVLSQGTGSSSGSAAGGGV